MEISVRRMDEESFDVLEKEVSEERERRHAVAELVGEINEKLYELAGLLTYFDSLRITNNQTGEVMTDMIDWDDSQEDNSPYHLAPKLKVYFAEGCKPRCPDDCDGCPWD